MNNHPANLPRQARNHGPLLKKEGVAWLLRIFVLPFKIVDTILAYLLIGCIKIYQKTLSPDHGFMKIFFPFGACKFHPTCSQYGIDALKKYGFMRGVPKLSWRILRCNPWSMGGNDEIT